MSNQKVQAMLEPLRKSLHLPASPAQTFSRFVERFGEWWPRASGHCVFGDESTSCRIEGEPDGLIVETARDGRDTVWGRIQVWDPPARLQFSWFPGRTEDTAQTVEVNFVAVPEGTRVDLEHRDWYVRNDDTQHNYQSYDAGWDHVLGTFGAHVSRGAQRWLGATRGRVAYFAATIAAPIERVFDLLASADGLDQWFTDGATLDPRPGGALVFRWRNLLEGGAVLEFFGRVRRCERPRCFAFDWQADSGLYDLACTIELVAVTSGTRVTITESGFRDDAEGLQDLLNRQSGWTQSLIELRVYAEHGIRLNGSA